MYYTEALACIWATEDFMIKPEMATSDKFLEILPDMLKLFDGIHALLTTCINDTSLSPEQ